MTRSATLLFFAIVLIVVLLPAAVVSLGRRGNAPLPEAPPEHGGETGNEAAEGSMSIRLYRVDTGEVTTLDLEEYLVGVVAAEMPASFGLEALKAQAVIARTYTLHRLRCFGGAGCDRGPEPADICSDSTHCQAWIDLAENELWPAEEREDNLARIRQAVRETAGEVVLYQGHPIEAVYHSTCGGQTEASHAVWSGGPVPYLQSISCPYCTASPHYRQEIIIPYEQFAAALQQELPLPVAGEAELPLELVEETPGGRVGLLKVNEALFAGKEVRRLLDLPSAAFTWEASGTGLVFHTRGSGHGVGLCQYGAAGAAAGGKTYRQIIAFYYPGTAVSTFKP